MLENFINICKKNGIKITGQRKIIAQVIIDSDDHPDVDVIYQRATEVDPNISIATAYRTVKLFDEMGIIDKLNFDGKSRYEFSDNNHHHHLIDVTTGKMIEFENAELEKLKLKISKDLGYELVDHTLELYGKPIKK